MSKVICADLSEYDNESIQVFFGEQATMDIPVALSYIKSGEVEIQRYADEVIIPKFDEYENSAERYSLLAEGSAERAEFAKKEVEELIEEARLWAVGTIEERPEGSAKYWAEKTFEEFLVTANALADEILTPSEPSEEPTTQPTIPDSLEGIGGGKGDSE